MNSILFDGVKKIPEGTRVVLASASPRRKELLSDMGVLFEVMPADCDESVPEGSLPRDSVRLLSERKARSVAEKLPHDALVIASDTLVDLFDIALGKPRDEDDAFQMLCEMSGKKHFVHTGVAVMYKGRLLSEVDTAGVQFLPYTPTEAWTYVCTGEPMDKAGSYGIQGLGGGLVDRLEGQMDTVVGLPTLTLDRLFSRLFSEEAAEMRSGEAFETR